MRFVVKQMVKPKFLNNAQKLIDAQKLKGSKMIAALAFEIQKKARLLIADNSDGTPKKRRTAAGQLKMVNVSNPFDPPNLDTGRLNKSIMVEPLRPSINNNVFYVGTNLDYGLFLEYGTVDMAPRPWLYPAYLHVMDRKDEIFDAVMKG